MMRQTFLSITFIERTFSLKQSFLIIWLVLVLNTAYTQQAIELNANSYPGTIPNGPTVVSQKANFRQNTAANTFILLMNPVSVTASLSNQQYKLVPGSPAGMMFGATITGANGPIPGSTSVFSLMNAKGNPSNSSYTSNPYGVAGTGIDVTQNYSFEFFNTYTMWHGTSGPSGNRAYYGDITFTFSRPVSDPVIHFGDLGSTHGSNSSSTEFELPAGSAVSLTKLSGTSELFIPSTRDKILNSASTPAAGCGSGAACGSVLINGTNLTSLTLKVYVRFRNTSFSPAGSTVDGDAFTVSFSFASFNISGNVYDDNNGLKDNTVNGSGSNAVNQLYALAVDAFNTIQGAAPVSSAGTFSFTNLVKGAYIIRLSSSSGALGATAQAASLPSGWINTGEYRGTGTGSDGMADGNLTGNIAASDINNFNFGIERTPVAYDVTYQIASQPAVNSTLTLNGAVGRPGVGNTPIRPNGNDAEDGALEKGDTIVINTLPNHGTLFYNNAPVSSGQVITNLNPDLLAIKFTGAGYSAISFTYRYKDAAAAVSFPASYSLFWSGVPLPVELIRFTANKEPGNNIMLKWETASELDNKGFNIQHSTDRQNWTTLAFIDKEANMNSGAKYSFTHRQVSCGMHYYRLQQMDFNGNYKFSPIQKINIANAGSVRVFPNPVRDVLVVSQANGDGPISGLKLYNASGSLVMEQSILKNNVSLPIAHLPDGLYILTTVFSNGDEQVQKIIKQ